MAPLSHKYLLLACAYHHAEHALCDAPWVGAYASFLTLALPLLCVKHAEVRAELPFDG